MLPSRERSLELFGRPGPDGAAVRREPEKRLDRLARTRLFTLGILDHALLRAEPVPVPFATTWVPGSGSGPPVCVVAENHHTWVSLVRAARAAADRHAGVHAGWGAGTQFGGTVPAVALLVPAVPAVHYFGDLDGRGLAIPTTAARVAVAAGLPPVRPALGLYRRLLATGVRETGVPPPADPVRLAGWLGPELAGAAAELLAAGVRLAQEAVSSDVLRGTGPAEWV